MERNEYQTLHDYESWYWWYLAQRAHLIDAVRCLSLPAGARVLDAGCGTGFNLAELSGVLPIRAFGCDNAERASALWAPGATRRLVLASVNALPYADGRFDAAVSVDVLCCRGVNVGAAMSELTRVLRPGGALVLFLPAYQWLLSRHDAAVHCVRRFSRPELRTLAAATGLTIERLSHVFPLFLPAIALARLVRRYGGFGQSGEIRSDLSPLPRSLNRLLLVVSRLERWLTRGVSVPFGSTLLLVARKSAVEAPCWQPIRKPPRTRRSSTRPVRRPATGAPELVGSGT